MRFGLHLSFSTGPERARAIGCQALQVFCGNPRGWQKKDLEPDFVSGFRAGLAAGDIDPLVVHATYLINLAAPDDSIYKLSCEGFLSELRRCVQLGARFYVIHIGNHKGSGLAAGRKRVAECMRRAVKEVEHCPEILVENTAGGGSTLGGTFEDVAAVMEESAVDRLGLCLDTCHALAAGYEIRTPEGVAATLDTIDRTVGLRRLRCLHVNDSKGELGSKLDRHEHIGQGLIGTAGFRAFLADRRLWDLPAILETPIDAPNDDVDNLQRIFDIAADAGAAERVVLPRPDDGGAKKKKAVPAADVSPKKKAVKSEKKAAGSPRAAKPKVSRSKR